jgi:hypothetical protein
MSAQSVTILSSAQRSGTTNSNAFTVPDWQPADPGKLTIHTSITAVTALTNLTMEVQWSPDGTNWYSVDGTKDITTGTYTAAANFSKQVTVKAPYYRVQAIVTGTNATFDCKATYQAV